MLSLFYLSTFERNPRLSGNSNEMQRIFNSIPSDFKFIKKQKIEPPYRSICSPGASVGCERLSEHSTLATKVTDRTI